MKWPTIKAPLPLLSKELTEQAARRRTYIVRVLYAVLLFAVFCTFSYGQFRHASSPQELLGRGREMFSVLIRVEFFGVLIFLPAAMSGVLTYEKERESLALLFLTDLRPREILLQKYLGRLVPIFTFLLLALPLLGICYAFGGISQEHLFSGIYILVLTCLQVGALSLMCSAYFRTSLAAFIASYLLIAALYVLVPLMFGMMLGGFGEGSGDLGSAFVPLDIFFGVFPSAGARGARGPGTFSAVFLRSIVVLLSIGAFLALARGFLVRRAFVPARNTVLQIFRHVDEFFASVNRSFGGVVLIRDKATLPGDAPIAWREVAKRSLGKFRYLFRILVLLEVPILLIGAGVLMRAISWDSAGMLSTMLFIVWGLAALAVTVMSANAIVAERTSQTLDVLLTTPLEGRSILKQKLRGVRRLILVLLIPFGSIFVLEAWWSDVFRRGHIGELSQAEYLVSSILSVIIYLPLISWLSLWISLRARTRFRAIITALLVLVVWTVGPWLVFGLLDASLDIDLIREGHGLFYLLSPSTMILVTQTGEFEEIFRTDASWPMLVNYCLYGFLFIAFRMLCLGNADRYLGRARPGRLAPGDAAGYALAHQDRS